MKITFDKVHSYFHMDMCKDTQGKENVVDYTSKELFHKRLQFRTVSALLSQLKHCDNDGAYSDDCDPDDNMSSCCDTLHHSAEF